MSVPTALAAASPHTMPATPPAPVVPGDLASTLVGDETLQTVAADSGLTEDRTRWTRYERVFVGDDATSSEVSSMAPLNYQDASGQWQPINDSLLPDTNTGFAWQNGADSYHVELPSSLADGPVRITRTDGQWLSFQLFGAGTTTGTATDNTVTYPDALPGASVTYAATPKGLRESITLAGATSTAFFAYTVSTSAGLTPATNADHSITVGDTDDHEVFHLPAAWAVDAAGDVSGFSTAVDVTLATPIGTTWGLTQSVDPNWLADSARTWPVTVDPTVTGTYPDVNDPAEDCLLMSGAPSTNLCANTIGAVGYHSDASDTNKIRREVLEFPLTAPPSTAHVLIGDVEIYEGATAYGTSLSTSVFQNNQTWSMACATWTIANCTTNWSTAGGTITGSAQATLTIGGSPNTWRHFGITPLTAAWVAGTKANWGVIMRGTSEASSGTVVQFNSSNATSHNPVIYAQWNDKPGTPGIVSPANGATNVYLKPTLSGTVSDPDGGPLNTHFFYRQHGTTGTPTEIDGTSTSGSTATASITTALTPGTSYDWWMTTDDGDLTSAQSATATFTVASPPPTPSVTSARQCWPAGTFSFSWSEGTDPTGIVGYDYSPPDQTLHVTDPNVPPTTTPVMTTGTTSPVYSTSNFADGTWYFHVRALNNAGAWGSTSDPAYGVQLDRVIPNQPTNLQSSTHPNSLPRNNSTATVTWTAATDNTGGCGVTGYKYAFDSSPTDINPSADTQIGVSPTSATATGLSDGTWYFHVRAIDAAGNVGNYSTYGPMTIVTHVPSITKVLDSVATNGVFSRGDSLQYTVTVTNPNTNLPLTVSGVSDTFDTGQAWGDVQVSSSMSPTPQHCLLLSTCQISSDGKTLSYTPSFVLPAVAAGQPPSWLKLTYTNVATGIERGCVISRNTATATDVAGSATTPSVPVTICSNGLGLEPWWRYVTKDVGVNSTAAVNVADGNLVVTSTDSTPIQGHGQLGFVLRRTYNSEDTTIDTLPGSFGRGWEFNLGATDDLAAGGVTGTAISLPSGQAMADMVTNPLGVTLVDRDGTRHVFNPQLLSTQINATAPSAALSTLTPRALGLPTPLAGQLPYTNLCIDTVYSPPAGVHLSLWRYVAIRSTAAATSSTACASRDTSTSPVVIGFVAMRPDRLRTEYQIPLNPSLEPSLPVGQLVQMSDGAGNHLDYIWNELNQLSRVSELGSGRQTTISYLDSNGNTPTTVLGIAKAVVTDPAGRQTTYQFTTTNGIRYLTRVTNETDGSTVNYAYQGQGTTNCTASDGQLCTITDERGNITRFSYNGNAAGDPAIGPARVTTITDRRLFPTTLAYSDASGQSGSSVTVTEAANGNGADQANTNRQQVYGPIDSDGRVWKILEGASGVTAANALHTTIATWDGGNPNGVANVFCRSNAADTHQDNNLCELRRLGSANTSTSGLATADEDTANIYDDAGMLQRTSRAATGSSPATLVTTYQYNRQYVTADGTDTPETEAVGAGGTVTAAATPPGQTLYTLADRTAMVPPRGNEPSATFTQFMVTYTIDDVPAVAPNTTTVTNAGGVSTSTPCQTATATGTATSNTGLLCATSQPYTGGTATTKYAYDSHGQRTTMTSPNGNDTTYAYYADGSTDLSGTTPAGGWLRTVTDAAGNFVAYGYDAAGHVVRTWDRNATAGQQASAYPGTLSIPPPGAMHQTLYGTSPSASVQGAMSAPWRFVSQTQNATGDAIDYTRDAAGNATSIEDIQNGFTRNSYDAANNLTQSTSPANAGLSPAAPTNYGFDAFGERITTTSPVQSQTNATGSSGHGVSARFTYDAVGRLVQTDRVRDLSAPATVPTGCYVAGTGSDPLLPVGALVCRTTQTFDSVDNVTTSVDGAGNTTKYGYDAAHRRTDTFSPATNVGGSSSHAQAIYDADGNVTVSCQPRQFTEGSGSCGSGAAGYLSQTTYDVADRRTSATSYRTSSGSAVTTVFVYDADGNVTTTSDPRGTMTSNHFDVVDRLVQTDRPRSSTVTLSTYFLYDPSGDRVATIAPGAATDNTGSATRVSAATFDADHRVVDTVTGLQVALVMVPTPVSPGIAAQNIASINSAMTTAIATGTTNTRYRQIYDVDGNVIARYEPRAFVPYTTPSGASVTDPVATPNPAYMMRTQYDADNRPVSQWTPRSNTGSGIPAFTNPATGTPEASQCTSSGPSSSPTYASDVNACVTTVTYDVNGNVVTAVLPTATSTTPNRQIIYSYSADDLLESVSGPDPAATTANSGRLTVATYKLDGAGRVVAATDALGLTTSTTYSPSGAVVQTDAPSASGTGMIHRTRYQYDANGERTVTDALRTPTGTTITSTSATESDTTRTSYTPDGLVDNVVAAGSSATDTEMTRYIYDPVGNVESVSSPSATAQDATNPSGLATTNTYTLDNLPLTTLTPIKADGSQFRRVSYGYDNAGRKTTVTSAVVGPAVNGINPVITPGLPQLFGYGANDRQTSQTGRADSSVESISTSYDPAGNPLCVIDAPAAAAGSCSSPAPGSTTTSNTYYLDGLLRTVSETVAGAARTTSYAYDGSGHLTARRQDGLIQSQTTTYTYNDAGLAIRMLAPIENGTTATTWAYNSDGQPTRKTSPNGDVTSWVYDTAGDGTLTRIGLSSNSTNATNGTYDLASYSYTYDENYRELTDTHTGTSAGGTTSLPSATYRYGYLPNGRLGSFTNGTASAQNISWDHDGNRLTYGAVQATYNPDNTIATTKATATSLTHTSTYDAYGRLTNDACSTYSYDGFDRTARVSVTTPNTDPTCRQGVTTVPSGVTYSYDGLDRQVGIAQTSGTAPTTTSTSTSLYYDGTSNVDASEVRTGNTIASTTLDYALTAGGLADGVLKDGGGGAQYLVGDRTDNVVNVTSSAGGATSTACAVRYDPFGTTVGDNTNAAQSSTCVSGTTFSSVLYHSARQDSATGAYQFGSRTYQPDKDAFTTPDTYRNAPSTANLGVQADPLTANTYGYVNGDPVNLVDPSGHRACVGEDVEEGCSEAGAHIQQMVAAIVRGIVHRVGQQYVQVSPHVFMSVENKHAFDFSIGYASYSASIDYDPSFGSGAAAWAREAEAWAGFCNTSGRTLCGKGLSLDWTKRRNDAWAAVHPLKPGTPNAALAMFSLSCSMDRFCAAAAFGEKGPSSLDKAMDSRAESGAKLSIDEDAVEAGEAAVAFGPGTDKAWSVLDRVLAKGSPFPGFKGGSIFKNREGRLPHLDEDGVPITYREWDVNPYTKGVNRGEERLVTGSDGSAYYTGDHYDTFLQFWGPGG